ncbi:MAG: hypothetical protein EPO32_04630 [Anaerolineae bacterium]|nr:MAG: hypothetical protein EPO32_04630 [Anaerolineae bacterium]
MAHPKPRFILPLVLIVAAVPALWGCSALDTPAATAEPSPQSVPPTEPAPTEAPSEPLPFAVYFLSDTTGTMQLWRLERDAITLTRLTDESTPVYEFEVSPANGTLAYATANQIYTIQPDGSGRTLLVDGGAVRVLDEYGFLEEFQRIGSLAWSPDGQTLAYGHEGVNFYSFQEGASRMVLPNITHDEAGNLTMSFHVYLPKLWSPDGSRLLVYHQAWETRRYRILDVASEQFAGLQPESFACCTYSWSPDSATLWFASHSIGMVRPGLWQYDLLSGIETVLVVSENANASLNFIAFPLQVGSDLYHLFATNTPGDYPDRMPFTLVRAPLTDINARTPLRPDTWVVTDLLWAPDGSLALGILPAEDVSMIENPSGALVLIPMDGSPGITLTATALAPAWGP